MRPKPRLFILNATCLDVIDNHSDWLKTLNLHTIAKQDYRYLKPQDADAVLADADALILPAVMVSFPLAEHMKKYQKLKVLSVAANGYEWLDVESATQNGIVVTNAPVREGIEVVADMTWGLIFAVMRQIPYHHESIRTGWSNRGMGVSVWGKTLGIIGLGNIGKAVARRARGFDMTILAAEPHPDSDFARTYHIELTNLDDLLRRADVVSLHLKLTDKTKGIIGRRELGLMKPSAYLINTARPQLVDEEALTEIIISGRLAGAAIDDPPTHPRSLLLDRPNVVFTPHLGNRAIDGANAVFRCAVENALAVLEGRHPHFAVNPQFYDLPRNQQRQPLSNRDKDP